MISTHVLDTSRGGPAAGIAIVLERLETSGEWRGAGRGKTDADGRARDLGPVAEAGTYRLTFDTAPYFAAAGRETFYPFVSIVFRVQNAAEHHHVPLLISPFGYSTYRGS